MSQWLGAASWRLGGRGPRTGLPLTTLLAAKKVPGVLPKDHVGSLDTEEPFFKVIQGLGQGLFRVREVVGSSRGWGRRCSRTHGGPAVATWREELGGGSLVGGASCHQWRVRKSHGWSTMTLAPRPGMRFLESQRSMGFRVGQNQEAAPKAR